MQVTASSKYVTYFTVAIDDDAASMIPTVIDFTIDDAPWIIEGSICTDSKAEDPRPEVAELHIYQREGGRPITPDIIRGIKLGEAKRLAIEQTAMPMRRQGNSFVPVIIRSNSGTFDFVPGAAHPQTARRATARKGRRPSVQQIQQVVDIYREVVAAGERTDLLVAVAEQIFVSTATVSRRLSAAKRLGLMGIDE